MTQQSLVASCSFRLRRSATLLGGLVLLVGLLALTAWNVTRSAALAQARQTYARGELVPCLEHALDTLLVGHVLLLCAQRLSASLRWAS
jgi:hypothetical protein